MLPAAVHAGLALWALVGGLMPAPTEAQLSTLRFRTWGLEDGMTHDAVFMMYQDRAGIVWVGTQDGLLEFDGERFRPFTRDVQDSTSLSDDHIMALHDDGEGGLWVGTWNAWLNRLDLATKRVERIPPPDRLAVPDGAGGEVIDAVVNLGGGRLGMATDLGALAYTPADGSYRPLDPEAGAGRDGRGATAIMAVPGEAIWIGYFDGRLRKVGMAGSRGGPGQATTVAGLDGAVSAIRGGPDNQVWVGTREGGVYVLDETTGEVRRRLHRDAPDAGRLPGDQVQDILIDLDGDAWIATLSGLAWLPADGRAPAHFVEDHRDPFSLPGNLVLTLLEDAQGVVWVGTFSGLGRIHPNEKAFTRFQTRTADRDGIARSGVLSIAGAGDDELWLGTLGGGLDRLSLRDGAVRHYPADPSDPMAPAHGEVKSLAVDVDGAVWIATMGGGINRFDPRDQRFQRVPVEVSGSATADARILSVVVDRGGAVWAGTQIDGLHRLDRRDGRFRRYRGPDGTWDLGSDYVWPMIEDHVGNLWIGASGGGLTRISEDRQSAELFTTENSGLHSDRILTLTEGPDGHIWIGTEGAGLGRLDPATRTFTSHTTQDGLPHDNVQAVRADRDGNLWISTNDGLARMDGDGRILLFSESAGLHGRRFYANASMALDDGRLAFGGAGGLTLVDPGLLRPVTSASTVVVTDFSVGGESRPLPAGAPVELGPAENFFSFRFAATDYADPDQVEYRYRLDPLDEDWIEIGNAKLANYTSVPPDHYVFRVSARNSFGITSEDAVAIPLVVHPLFYATWWFRLLVVVALVSVLRAAYVVRMRQIHRLHDLRFLIAGRLHDEIGANLSAIRLKSSTLAAAGLDEPARETFASVARITDATLQSLRETVWFVKARYDSVSGLFSKLEEAAGLLLSDSIEYRYTTMENPPDHRVDMEVRESIYLSFKEALQNVVKHSGASRVEIDVDYRRPFVTVSISDDGVGFDPGTVEAGHGLLHMRRRAERRGVQLRVDSAPGDGTRVEMRYRVK